MHLTKLTSNTTNGYSETTVIKVYTLVEGCTVMFHAEGNVQVQFNDTNMTEFLFVELNI